MDRKEYAADLHENSCNCCQAVLCAFAEDGKEAEMEKLGAACGLGMGNMEGTCGALTAVELLIGLNSKTGKQAVIQGKAAHEKFREMCGATLCKEIKGRDTGESLCSCADCVRNAVEILENIEDGSC